MIGDTQLLTQAAKAAGLEIAWSHRFLYPRLARNGTFWNPLENDGDALRLAVKLDMSVDICEDEAATYVYAEKVPRVYAVENWSADKAAATRRAIVRAAAKIGQSMEAA